MTTIVPFTPAPDTLFQFQATLDGAVYTVTVPWLTYAQTWYIQISDLAGNVIVYRSAAQSPPDQDISLTAGYFTTTLVFRAATQNFEIGD